MLTLPPLPYGLGDLAPTISERNLYDHYAVLHRNYVMKANALLGERAWDVTNDDLPRLISEAPPDSALAHALSQHANHSFFWRSLTPNYTEPSPRFLSLIDQRYPGGALALYQDFATLARTFFASGWAWIAWNPSTRRFSLETTTDGDGVAVERPTGIPLLTLDLWEHAYYLDYQTARARYVDEVMSGRWNWTRAEERWAAA